MKQIIGILLILWVGVLTAQTREVSEYLLLNAGTGVHINKKMPVNIGIEASIIPNWLLSVDYIRARSNDAWQNTSSNSELSLKFGSFYQFGEQFVASYRLGLGVFTDRVLVGDGTHDNSSSISPSLTTAPVYSYHNESSLSFPVHMDLMMILTKNIGVGLKGYYSYNNVNPFYGVLFSVHFGRIYFRKYEQNETI